jgi:hypothetical protein
MGRDVVANGTLPVGHGKPGEGRWEVGKEFEDLDDGK